MDNILEYLDELDLTEQERNFFIGWCKEGGEEFQDILDALLFVARTSGHQDANSV